MKISDYTKIVIIWLQKWFNVACKLSDKAIQVQNTVLIDKNNVPLVGISFVAKLAVMVSPNMQGKKGMRFWYWVKLEQDI